MWGCTSWIAISPSGGRASWAEARAAAASFFSRNWTLRQTVRPVSLSIGPIDPRHAAARRLGDDREPALEVHPCRRYAFARLDGPGPNISFSLLSIEMLSSCSRTVGGIRSTHLDASAIGFQRPQSRRSMSTATVGQAGSPFRTISRIRSCRHRRLEPPFSMSRAIRATRNGCVPPLRRAIHLNQTIRRVCESRDRFSRRKSDSNCLTQST